MFAPPSKKVRTEIVENSLSLQLSDVNADIDEALLEIDIHQDEIEAINLQAYENILKTEQNYSQMRQPYFLRRAEHICKVPRFWFTAFTNHSDLGSLITEYEEDCLQHMIKIEVDGSNDFVTGYKIHFYFEPNPYFENVVLTKEFKMENIFITQSVSTEIIWKEGMNLVCKKDEYKPKLGKHQLEHTSFFNWFIDNSDAPNDSIAEIIKDDLWMNPLEYFFIPDVHSESNTNEESDDEDEEKNDKSKVKVTFKGERHSDIENDDEESEEEGAEDHENGVHPDQDHENSVEPTPENIKQFM